MHDLATLLQREGPELIRADTPRAVLAEIRNNPRLAQAKDELIRGAQAELMIALIEQRKMKAISDRLELCHVEGVGTRIATIHPVIYERMRNEYGPKCWYDKDFLHDTLAKNPELRVRCAPRRLTLRVEGRREQATPSVQPSGLVTATR